MPMNNGVYQRSKVVMIYQIDGFCVRLSMQVSSFALTFPRTLMSSTRIETYHSARLLAFPSGRAS